LIHSFYFILCTQNNVCYLSGIGHNMKTIIAINQNLNVSVSSLF